MWVRITSFANGYAWPLVAIQSQYLLRTLRVVAFDCPE
jgi:hypothetical protein